MGKRGRPRQSSPSSQKAHGNGRKYEPFVSGEFLTLSGDPRHCYIVGCRFPRGQVIETLAFKGWANGTRFTTMFKGEVIEYEVKERELIRVG